MPETDAIACGREAFARREWSVAFEQLAAADRQTRLAAADLERLASAAYLVGKDAEAMALWKRLHQELAEAGEVARAARFGFWLGLTHLLRGHEAESRGWVGRTHRLLESRRVACVEEGYVLAVTALLALNDGDATVASASFGQAIEVACRFDEPDLLALGLLGRGQATIMLGEIGRGVAMLDEAMVAVVSGDVSPILSGILYCASILSCQEIFDVRRASEWTKALAAWCASQPQSVPFRGECLVHRAEILQLEGDWTTASDEARRACECLSDRLQRLAGRAFYQRGELHRLRGELEHADAMYREALRNGYEPQPGVSLLRLAQGQLEAAVAAIQRVAAESSAEPGHIARPSVLGSYVEIMLDVDLVAARRAAEELVAIAADRDSPLLRAMAGQAKGAVLLAEGDARAALAALREAWTEWQELDAPYESARLRVLIARACEELGDRDTAQLHVEAAAAVFERLGATPDADRLTRTSSPSTDPDLARLTGRELEVLVLVASGKTNRQIAAQLAISEHTVARHLSNIYNKLGVATRTAASAYAFAHRLC